LKTAIFLLVGWAYWRLNFDSGSHFGGRLPTFFLDIYYWRLLDNGWKIELKVLIFGRAMVNDELKIYIYL
jgi:hypothetical protein